MKFFCEYCGNRIDAEKEKKCSGCGASYRKNKSFIKLQEEKAKEQEQNNEFKQQVMNHTLGTMKAFKWIIFIPIVIFVLVFSIIIFNFINMNKESNKVQNDIESIIDIGKDKIETIIESEIEGTNKQEEEKEITVDFNEYGETKEYKVKVTKYEAIKDVFNIAEEGYEVVKFHLLVENLTDNKLIKEDVNCIVDGIAQTNYYSSGYSDIPMFIQKGLTVKGTATFIVPKDATSYNIRYGDYIIVEIKIS